MRIRPAYVLLVFAVVVSAQSTRVTPKRPSSDEQKEMVARLRAQLAEYEQHIPDFACRPLLKLADSDTLEGPSDLRGLVIADLNPPQREIDDEKAIQFPLESAIRNLAEPNAKFVFARFATLSHKRMAVFHFKRKSKTGVREADTYLDRESGRLSRISFHGVSTPNDGPLFCHPASK